MTEIAAGMKRDPDLVSKHLRVLRDAGAVEVERDEGYDARRQLYAIPAPFLASPGIIDYGFCLLRFG